ncbi:hypothetical protein F5X99DRAFT_279795 [Biscogniauxia marginata]|nr:hypothetical protein F5X99DRAFT_279795 [Biscogniauxia marginata]
MSTSTESLSNAIPSSFFLLPGVKTSRLPHPTKLAFAMAFQDTLHASFLKNGLRYDFITEMAPGVWKIYRKMDRMEYLAHDVTDMLFTSGNQPGVVKDTLTNSLLSPNGHNLLEPLLIILNHENLVSLVDVIQIQVSQSGKVARNRWFTVWNYCDAGNLGNLLVPESWRPPIPGKGEGYPGDETPEKPKDDPNWFEDPTGENSGYVVPPPIPKRKFLPESLCWHVLCSVMKALAWLHDGAGELFRDEDGDFRMKYVDAEWQPMLHRNIAPGNIFLGHPRRGEWYGACRLGNYSELFISSHFKGFGGMPLNPDVTKAIAPPPGKKFTALEDLIAQDRKLGSVHPAQPDQPYTIVSEWRALGEIIQGMMVEPGTWNHVDAIRQRSVQDNLRHADYTAGLKNFVVKLMQLDPWVDIKKEKNPAYGTSYVTSELFCEAWMLFGIFRRARRNAEGQNMFTGEAAATLQWEQDVIEQGITQNSVTSAQNIVAQLDPSKVVVPPTQQT